MFDEARMSRVKAKREQTIPADELTALSAGWSPEPGERQIRERVAVMGERRREGELSPAAVAAKRAKASQAADTLRREEMQTALLAMIGAAELLGRCDCYGTALETLHLVIDVALRTRFTLQTGRSCGGNIDTMGVADRLRTFLLMEAEEYKQARQAITLRKKTAHGVGIAAAYARKAVNVFAPWTPPSVDRKGGAA